MPRNWAALWRWRGMLCQHTKTMTGYTIVSKEDAKRAIRWAAEMAIWSIKLLNQACDDEHFKKSRDWIGYSAICWKISPCLSQQSTFRRHSLLQENLAISKIGPQHSFWLHNTTPRGSPPAQHTERLQMQQATNTMQHSHWDYEVKKQQLILCL